MSDKFPGSSGEQPLSLEKCLENSNIDQSWCFNKEKKWNSVFSWQVWVCNHPVFTGKKYCLFHPAPNPRLTKTWFLGVSELSKCTLGHSVLFHERRCQGGVLCECWLPYLLLPWLGETVLSDNFPARSYKQAVSLRKHKYVTKMIVRKRKINQYILGAGLRLQLTNFHRRKICLLTSCPFIQVHKSTFFLHLQSCVKTFLGHTVPLHVNTCEGSVFCNHWRPYILLPW